MDKDYSTTVFALFLLYFTFGMQILSEVECRDPFDQPNIVLIVVDDMGYGDLSSFGHPTQELGAIDRMVLEGMKFTQWYSPESLCSPSRGAMLTGRLPVRVGLYGPAERVFVTDMMKGLPKDEITIAEALKEVGYATGMTGKWHLGINEFHASDGNHLPFHHGFDDVGNIIPFTHHATCDEDKKTVPFPNRGNCFLYYNTTIIQQPTSYHNLTKAMVFDAKAFIFNNEHQPFFYFFSLFQLHDSLVTTPEFQGSSVRGKYGDNVNEVHWAVGEILETIKSLKLERNTLVLFVSDHGSHLEVCSEGGKNSPFRGGKENSWEGGFRIPAIAWWPGVIQPGVLSQDIISTMDIFNTALELAGAVSPADRIIDGISFKPHLLSSGKVPHTRDTIHYYCGDRLMAMRYKAYKAHFFSKPNFSPDRYSALCREGWPEFRSYSCYFCYNSCIRSHELSPLLYNIEEDPEELYQLSSRKHKKILMEIWQAKEQHLNNLVKGRPLFTSDRSVNIIPCCNPPYCYCNYTPKNYRNEKHLLQLKE